jgi:hypothetical protein
MFRKLIRERRCLIPADCWKQVTAAPLSDPVITRTIVLALPANRLIRRHVRHAVDSLVQCVKDAAQTGRGWRRGGLGRDFEQELQRPFVLLTSRAQSSFQ